MTLKINIPADLAIEMIGSNPNIERFRSYLKANLKDQNVMFLLMPEEAIDIIVNKGDVTDAIISRIKMGLGNALGAGIG